MARILILSAGVGAGHNRAAEALSASCGEWFPDAEAKWYDTLRFTSRAFRTVYADSYLYLINHTPGLWGMLYDRIGKKRTGLRNKLRGKLVRSYDRMAYDKLIRAVNRFEPDAVICTHFLPTGVLTARGRELPLYVVVTDFDVHNLWVNPKASAYFVASDQVRWQLAGYGYPAERIHVTGIPVHPRFVVQRGREKVRRELGLPSKVPVLLLMSGGFGVGDMGETVDRLLQLPGDFRLVAVCGKNESLRRKIAARVRSARGRLQVHGFITNVHDQLEAADVVVTKAGGLTVSECLARGVPMILTSPIPGQEERNCDYLLEAGAAWKAPRPDVLDFKVRELLEDPRRLVKMREAAASVARPGAGREIIRTVLQDLS